MKAMMQRLAAEDGEQLYSAIRAASPPTASRSAWRRFGSAWSTASACRRRWPRTAGTTSSSCSRSTRSGPTPRSWIGCSGWPPTPRPRSSCWRSSTAWAWIVATRPASPSPPRSATRRRPSPPPSRACRRRPSSRPRCSGPRMGTRSNFSALEMARARLPDGAPGLALSLADLVGARGRLAGALGRRALAGRLERDARATDLREADGDRLFGGLGAVLAFAGCDASLPERTRRPPWTAACRRPGVARPWHARAGVAGKGSIPCRHD